MILARLPTIWTIPLIKNGCSCSKNMDLSPWAVRLLKVHNGIGGEISEQNEAIKMINIKTRINPTDEELAEFENICAVKARNRPWNKIWFFTGESNPGCMPLEGHPDAFAKFLLATLSRHKERQSECQSTD